MRRQCPDCRTVTGGAAPYCGSCGYQFQQTDAVRALAAVRTKKNFTPAIFTGLAVAVAQYFFYRLG